MTILAFLQCQWFRNPDAVRAIYAKHTGDLDRRAKLRWCPKLEIRGGISGVMGPI
jgi:hypothetical protein